LLNSGVWRIWEVPKVRNGTANKRPGYEQTGSNQRIDAKNRLNLIQWFSTP